MADNSNDDNDHKAKDGDETPAIYSLGHTGGQPTFSRRSFLELAAVAVGGVHREGDLRQGDVGGELFAQAVGVDEEAVVLLFEALHLGDGVAVLGDPGGVAGIEGGGGF